MANLSLSMSVIGVSSSGKMREYASIYLLSVLSLPGFKKEKDIEI